MPSSTAESSWPRSRPRSGAAVLSSGDRSPWAWCRYGAYLLHWPMFLWLRQRHGCQAAPASSSAPASVAIAAVSYRLIEEPVRRGKRFPVRVLVPTGAALVCAWPCSPAY